MTDHKDTSHFLLIHATTGAVVATVSRATTWWAKGVGVMGRRSLPADGGLWLPGVSAVHTCFVQMPLDLLFLDADLRAVKVATHVAPWRPIVTARGASHVIELAAGRLAEFAGTTDVGAGWRLTPVSREV